MPATGHGGLGMAFCRFLKKQHGRHLLCIYYYNHSIPFRQTWGTDLPHAPASVVGRNYSFSLTHGQEMASHCLTWQQDS